jgi:pimeloyl-ACP methyl ester carboxylesterase
LAARGLSSVAARLPSCGEINQTPGVDGPGLDDDVAEVRRLLGDGVPTVLVGHSYGGVVATAAADTGDVGHLVYVSSFLPDVGEALSSFGAATPPPYLEFSEDGRFCVRREMARDLFLHDCDPGAIEGAFARLAWQSAAVLNQPVHWAGWKRHATTYLVCADDRATPPAVQRAQAQRAAHVVELPTGHHPFLSRPELVAQAILDLK